MTMASIAQPKREATVPAPKNSLQRKCACGGSSGMGSACVECRQKETTRLQRYSGERADLSALTLRALNASAADPPLESASHDVPGHDFAHVAIHRASSPVVQRKGTLDEPPDMYEQEADRIDRHLAGGNRGFAVESAAPVSRVAYPLIQRAPVPGSSPGPAPAPTATPTPTAGEQPTSQQAATRGLIVDDDAGQINPGQMRKGAFLDQLQTSVCAAADAELARVGRNTQGCPYIEGWIGRYRGSSAEHLERALTRYSPEAANARSAADYIPAVTERVRRGVAQWATTGQITGIPEELKGQLPGAGAPSALGAVGAGVSGLIGGVGRALGGIFTKLHEGRARNGGDPQEIQGQLGAGQSLGGGVKSRMESAFGHSFSQVKVHTDTRAAELSSGLNARAFTIGNDVAFGAGEYRPGTLVGDALLAHELAHVVQQSGGAASGSGPQMQGGEYGALEEDADRSAISAVASMWGVTEGMDKGASYTGSPRLRSGMRLSRCGGVNTRTNPCTTRATPPAPVKTVTVRHSHLSGGKGVGAFSTELAYANRVYAIAGIKLAAGDKEELGDTETKKILGEDAELEFDTPEESSLKAHNRASGQTTAYYIKAIHGSTDIGRRFGDVLAVTAVADTRTLPHELGHVLIGSGHPGNNDNIMAQSTVATGVDCLSDDQIEAARDSSLAQ